MLVGLRTVVIFLVLGIGYSELVSSFYDDKHLKVKSAESDSSTSKSPTSSQEYSRITESKEERELLKIPIGGSKDNYYYDVGLKVNGQHMSVRLDIGQPEIWIMNQEDFVGCSEEVEWYSTAIGTKSSYDSDLTTATEYQATICANEGRYSPRSNMPKPSVYGVSNGEAYTIPYMNSFSASGVFATDNIYLNASSNSTLELTNFTFVDASSANDVVGGLGLAGKPAGSGFLDHLVDQGFINSSGYSLWLNDYDVGVDRFGELIPGVVDKQYYTGTLYSFDMLPHDIDNPTNEKSQASIDDLQLPILELNNVIINNWDNGKTEEMMGSNESVPVLLNSRSPLSFLPLDTIIQIAIQYNAYYSQDFLSWIIQCDTVTNVNSSLDFVFHDLKIKVPITNFVEPMQGSKGQMKFANGKEACYLRFYPSDMLGFNSLGLPFVAAAYMVVDNEGGLIALANKKNLSVSSLNTTIDVSSTISKSSIAKNKKSNSSSDTIGYIRSGYIPFASYINSSTHATLTEVSTTSANVGVIPNAIISDNEVVLRQSDPQLYTFFSGYSSSHKAASKSKNGGHRLVVGKTKVSDSIWGDLSTVSSLMGILTLLSTLLVI